MKEIFNSYGIKIDSEKIAKFEKYKDLLIYYNSQFNLTAITDEREIVIKHFVDSLLICENIKCGNVIDVGSGGGFPAIPLKIVNDELNYTLLEATGKKCEFLKTVIKELDLKNAVVINGRAEDFAKNSTYRESFDFCTARAVARLNTLCEYCLPFVKKGGKFFAYKGLAEEELKEAQNAIKILGGKLEKVYNFTLEDAQRNVICIAKKELTPPKYPRGNGKERKNPL